MVDDAVEQGARRRPGAEHRVSAGFAILRAASRRSRGPVPAAPGRGASFRWLCACAVSVAAMKSLLGSGLKIGPERVVAFLRKMGPTATKIGQHLALRPDLLPQEYTDAFLTLVDRVPPFPWAEAEGVIRAELGRGAADV